MLSKKELPRSIAKLYPSLYIQIYKYCGLVWRAGIQFHLMYTDDGTHSILNILKGPSLYLSFSVFTTIHQLTLNCRYLLASPPPPFPSSQQHLMLSLEAHLLLCEHWPRVIIGTSINLPCTVGCSDFDFFSHFEV